MNAPIPSPANSVEKHIPIRQLANDEVRIGRKPVQEQATEIVVRRDGDTIDSIVVMCKCGESLEVRCHYATDESETAPESDSQQ